MKVWYRYMSARNDLVMLKKNIDALESKNTVLQKKLDDLSDPAKREQEAKSQFYLRRPEEKVVFLVPDKTHREEDANQKKEMRVSFLDSIRGILEKIFERD